MKETSCNGIFGRDTKDSVNVKDNVKRDKDNVSILTNAFCTTTEISELFKK